MSAPSSEMDARLQKLQLLLERGAPALFLALVVRAFVYALFSLSMEIFARVRKPARVRKRFCRVAKAVHWAGAMTCGSTLLAAWVAGGAGVALEVQQCRQASLPRPHALVVCANAVLLLGTARVAINVLAVSSLAMSARGSPLAGLLTVSALVEWVQPRGALTAAAVAATLCVFSGLGMAHFITCPGQAAADAVLFSMCGMGAVKWFCTAGVRAAREIKML